MSISIHNLSYYIKLLGLEKGRKVWFYNHNHTRYEEWWYFDAYQNKFAFYNKTGKQISFTGEMLSNCARTKDECKLLVYKKKFNHLESKIERHNDIIRRAKEEIKKQSEKNHKFQKKLKKLNREFEDIIKKYPEEFI